MSALEKDLQRERNRLEKAQATQTPEAVLTSINVMISHFETERAAQETRIDDHIQAHSSLKDNQALLESIPGVGKVVSRHMLMILGALTFSSASQCAAYLGLIPVQKESGTSVKARPQLAKNGNPAIRAKLYRAAISAKKYNPDISHQYLRLTKRGKSKVSALGATMRKLVQIGCGVLKHQKPYQPQVTSLTTCD